MVSKSGIVIKSVGGVFTVKGDDGNKYVCFAPKKLRYNDFDLVVGDRIKFEDIKRGKGVVNEVISRKNKLMRPEIANVDVCFIVLACQPQPDLYLCDKVLINCFQERIEPVIVVNKMDVSVDTAQLVRENYGGVADIVCVSAVDSNSVNQLTDYLKEGKIACFAGQSAVGKTSILNALLPDVNAATGGLSSKSGRGMHTTRHSELHTVGSGFIADTCGFSLCDLHGIRPDELRLYLDDFVELAHKCKYTSCTHTVEPDCAVKQAVERGEVCKARYERYLEEYRELKEFEENKY